MRFVVCGEALIDLMPEEMISPAESRWIARSGGGPFNTAAALARLGKDTRFLGRLSTDALGRQLRSHLEHAGVDLGLAVPTEDPTSLAVVSLDEQGRASYHFHFAGTSAFSWRAGELPELEHSDWLHFGSIGAVIGSYGLLDARVSLAEIAVANSKLRFSLWGRNLTDEEYQIFHFIYVVPTAMFGDPRSYGADLTLEF